MKRVSRRDLLKTSLLGPAAVAAAEGLGPMGFALRTTGLYAGPLPKNGPRENVTSGAVRERLLLDFGRRFHLGNADEPSKDFGFGEDRIGNFNKTGNFLPAGTLAFDDNDWQPVNLPHDWAVELPFQNDAALARRGYYPLGRTYPATSIGWYRRVFALPAADAGKRLTIEFDGSYRETMVMLNGFYIGNHSGGYDPFSFDITDFANAGSRNTLLVRFDATLNDGWFYEGAGIYRHVWLVKTAPLHVKRWGTFVSADVLSGSAALSIRTEVSNHGGAAESARIISTVLDPSGETVGKVTSILASIATRQDQIYEQQLMVNNPRLWSLEVRNLYRLVTEVQAGDQVVDRYETRFGIRTITFNPQSGFFLNGKSVKVKGTCNHQDHAGLGVALPDAVQYYRVRRLQDLGCNALRTSHNPPTPKLLDACDELGMLVLDETRMMSSNSEGPNEFGDLVRRDRNHPSVFMWSMGNEERLANTERGVLILKSMKAVATQYDGTRPVSIAPIGAVGTGGLAVSDVIGYNYMDTAAADYHRTHPRNPVIGTETVSAVGTRGIYVIDPAKGHVGSYDPYTATGRASAEGWWSFCDAQSWLAGGFVWTGFDYRGEPSPNEWPNVSSQYGIMDTCGFPKDSFFYYQSWWTAKPVLHLFPHWNWPGLEGKQIAVWGYSNLDEVELLLNGQSLGKRQVEKNMHVAWIVSYAPGTLEARGYKDGKLAMMAKRETTGPPARLEIHADRQTVNADGADVAMFTVEVRDAQDRVVPITDNQVTFSVSGSGQLIGVGDGDPADQESDKGTSRRAFSGLCMAIVQSTKANGPITVQATSPGLTPGTVTLEATKVALRPQVEAWNRESPFGRSITGLWRPMPSTVAVTGPFTSLVGNRTIIFTLHQSGGSLTGTVEGGDYTGDEAPRPIEIGNVNGSYVSFRAGNSFYSGLISGDKITLVRKLELAWLLPHPEPAPKAPQPAIGPPPTGSDPSGAPSAHPLSSIPVVLHRVQR